MALKQKLSLLLCGLSLCAALTQAQDATPTWLLSQLSESIADGPATLRTDLARIALTEMAAEYANEAEQARYEMQRRGKKKSLGRWSGEVQKLADDYASLAESITLATPVALSTGPDGSLYLQVAGELVVVSIPRMNEQYAFEQRVVTRFCSLNRCEDLMDVPVRAATATRPRARATTLWSFSQDAGPTCSSPDKLVFMYRNTDDLGRKRETCTRVVAELNALASAIKTEIASGTRVNWQRLEIHTTADGDEQVILNGTGHYLMLPLPTLAARQELLTRVRPWLAAKVNGTPYTLVITHAEPLMAPDRR